MPVRKLRPEVPEPVAALIERAFSREPSRRPQSAAEYVQVLAPLYDERIGTPLAIAAMVRGFFGPGTSNPNLPAVKLP